MYLRWIRPHNFDSNRHYKKVEILNPHTKGNQLTHQARIELKDLHLNTQIGTYAAGETVPDAHILDLILHISPQLVLIKEDGMQFVFDYDPLVAEIDRLAKNQHYDTQERLMTRIAYACTGYPEIEAIEIGLRKFPIMKNSGSLGVRLAIDKTTFETMR